MTTTATSPAQHLRRMADAITALTDYWPEHINSAPVALKNALADAITSTPPAVLAQFDADHTEAEITALLEWAIDYTERRDYPRFFELLEKLRAIGEQEAVNNPEHSLLFVELHRSAPPRYRQEADAILADALPPTTHVNDEGQAVFSIEQMAQHFDKTPEEVAADVDRLIADGLIDPATLHTGPTHPLQ